MTDKEKLEKLIEYIKNAEKCYTEGRANSGDLDFGYKLGAIYDIELYIEHKLGIPMEMYDDKKEGE